MTTQKHIFVAMLGLIAQIVTVTIGFLLTPLLLRQLGVDQFGIWATLNVIIAYESLSDLGITTAIVMFVNQSSDDDERLRLINTGILINTGLTLCFILVLVWQQEWLLGQLFKVPYELLPLANQAFDLTLFTLLVMVIARTLAAALDALQYVDLRYLIDIVGMFVWGLTLWIVIDDEASVVGVATVSLGVGFLRVVMMAIGLYLIYPAWRFRFGISRQKIRPIIRYSLNSQGASLGQSISEPLLRSFIGAGLGSASVGTVQISSSLAAIPNSLAQSMVAALFPAIARLHSQNRHDEIASLAAQYLRYVIYLIVPPSLMLCLVAHDLVEVWLGQPYPEVVLSIQILVIAFTTRALTMIPWRICWGTGYSNHNSVAMALHIIGLFIGSMALLTSNVVSLAGLLLIYVGSLMMSAIYLFWRTGQILPQLLSKHSQELLSTIIRTLAVGSVGLIIFIIIVSLLKLSSLSIIIVSALITIGIYGGIIGLVLPRTELNQILAMAQHALVSFQGRS
ncbi:oligosaccharide flippase family protein [Candidatus Chloroploca asiatica]|uniref:Polysaccharide biosynthesis protein C-terminal domain-containing protein n=1 Tax=Candidatus Chloroploca asiatica TaxID=1506545 RepID=A0A2H3KLZ7_9CHLR|nr:oligosaccharide flippase family protein [Candidatus Chloroploca asiatica]PDV99079.1 hypothetical protein A9Q02_13420 [Candidatus Chloroploca asiatica]